MNSREQTRKRSGERGVALAAREGGTGTVDARVDCRRGAGGLEHCSLARTVDAIAERWWQVTVLAGLALAARPSPAHAHLVTTGLGPVYDGLLHLALAPEDLVPVLALALLAGRRGAAHGRWALFVLPGAWLLGGWFGLAAHGSASPVVAAMSFVVLGILVAADVRLPLAASILLAAVLGLWHGYLNGIAMAPGPGAMGLVGVVVAVFALVAVAASLVVSVQAAWVRIAIRVAGSWIAAVGLLLLGWGLRRGA